MGALRAGAGLVTLGIPISAGPLISGRIPEVIYSSYLPGDSTSFPDPSAFDAVAAGPGLGNSTTTTKMISFILANWKVPLVLDADALNVLNKPLQQLKGYDAPLIITPHPGELARLTGCRPDDIDDRNKAASELSRATGATILLKGRPSMVFTCDGGSVTVAAGNSGLATGGSGDILTGVVASLLVQGSSPAEACIAGAFLHGLAADMAVENFSARSLLPSDITDYMGKAFRMIENGDRSTLLTTGGRYNGAIHDK
jgi:NAD(P)H-hydrate epimerase